MVESSVNSTWKVYWYTQAGSQNTNTYGQTGRPTGGQQPVNLNGEKRDNGSNARSPLADSFVL